MFVKNVFINVGVEKYTIIVLIKLINCVIYQHSIIV